MSVPGKEYNASGKAGEFDEYETKVTDQTSTREEKARQGEEQIAQTPTRLQNKAFSSFLAEHIIWQSTYGATMGFFLYFAMYGIRKPFKAATFKDEDGNKIMWFGTEMTLKTTLILAQLLGYLSSKFIGIKVTSEAKGRQDYILLLLCLASESALILFGILGTYATDWSFIALFLNGLPLGMVWGLVVSYFEGRGGSDFMLVCLCLSFIVGSGAVKDIALALLDAGYSQFWVPAIEGAMFSVLWLLCVVGLNQLPPPSKKEMEDRGERISMNHQMRLDYYLAFWPGLLALWVGAMCLTAYRDYRDSFSVEIFEDMGYDVIPGTLTKTEAIIAGILLIPIASLVFIKNNNRAFEMSMAFLVSGAIILLVTVSFYMASPFDGTNYYIVTGLGSYLGYVPYNSVLYERLIAALREPCTVSYLMSVMDALGYLAVFAIFLTAEFAPQFNSYLETYNALGQAFGWIMLGLYTYSSFYFFIMRRDVLYGPHHDDDEERLKATVGHSISVGKAETDKSKNTDALDSDLDLSKDVEFHI